MGWANDAFFDSMMRAGVGRPGSGSSITTSSGTLSNGCFYSTDNYDDIEEESRSNISNQSRRYVKYYDFPTEKQQKAMNFITNTIGVIFEGKTKKEASDFIKENLEIANEIK